MEKQGPFWEETFKVRAYEVDHNGRAKFQTLFNYLQEAASNHAAFLKLSKTDFDRMGLTWVLSRFHVRVYHYPFWNQHVKVQTWPSLKERLFALRDFEMFDEKGKALALATSSWMMIDFKARRAVRLPEFLAEYTNQEKGRALEDTFERLPELQTTHHEKEFQVRLSDLDMNRHVNSAVYIDWALEAVPEEIRTQQFLHEVEVNYRAEAVYGQRILSQVEIADRQNDQTILYHRLLRTDREQELCRMVSRWRPK
ncbi:acyl-[acyl-carrier-protein] thioesterase [Calditrichota bacterium LG25]